MTDLDLDAIEALLRRLDPVIDHTSACHAYWSHTADGTRQVECQCGHSTILAALPVLVAEVRRLRAALDEAFDLDHLPIPIVVNLIVDAWNDEDGYDPGDHTEVLAALLSAISEATTPGGSNDVLDLPRAGEADRG